MRRAPLLLLAAAFPVAAAPPVLTGVAIGGGARVALLNPAEGGTVEVQEGETVAGYAVRRILPDRVLLEREGQALELCFGTSRGGEAPAVDTGGATFGLVVNPPAPAPD